MTYKNPNLNGLSILDTPGFNSNDSEDKERTIEVINECDALFWVFDVNAGTVNRSSISLIKEKLNKPLYVVINKQDIEGCWLKSGTVYPLLGKGSFGGYNGTNQVCWFYI